MPPDAPPATVFHDDIEASDISQGELGNCWFMCALAALTEFPGLVQALFVDRFAQDGSTTPSSRGMPTRDALGMYRLRFCIHGQWTETTVDDHFPCRPEVGGGPLFSRSTPGGSPPRSGVRTLCGTSKVLNMCSCDWIWHPKRTKSVRMPKAF